MLRWVLVFLVIGSAAVADEFESLILAPSITPPSQAPVTVERPAPIPAPVVKPAMETTRPRITPPVPPRRIETATAKPEPKQHTETQQTEPEIAQAEIDGDVMILPTNPLATNLSQENRQWLQDHISRTMLEHPDRHLMMTSYARPTDISEISGRRIALSTGLLVREHLIAAGIKPERITLKAVSAADNTPETLPDNRIEFFFQDH